MAPPELNIAIKCQGVTKAYGTGQARVQALCGVDLEVPFGELLMLVGPSGCGKTTLISVMSSILAQDEGDCVVLGHNVRTMSSNERLKFRRESIGFVFQVFNLFPTITAIENVTIPLLLNSFTKKEAAARATNVLHSVGLGERTSALPSQLSGGQQQRVAIARALVHNPQLVLCDEPTSSLDHTTGHKVMETLRSELRGPNRALVVVTHDSRIFEFADRIAYMEDGRITDVVKCNGAGSRQ